MCEYCEFEYGTAKEPFYKSRDGRVTGYLEFFEDGAAIVLDKDPYSQWDTGDTFIMDVNNCPMCGRDLTSEVR